LTVCVSRIFPESLDEFNYHYVDGKLKRKDGGKFVFVSQRHYESLGCAAHLFAVVAHESACSDAIVPHIQQLMVQAGLQEVWLPIGVEHKVEVSGSHRVRVASNIFLSPDALTNENVLMVLIQGGVKLGRVSLVLAFLNQIVDAGSGAVRAGMWARALCINESLELGSVLPYIQFG
jgi:hypothetical protein